jgi:deoxyribonuclease V
MKAALDVHYVGDRATAACVLFAHWRDPEPIESLCLDLAPVAPYRAGHFFARELPCLLAVLARCRRSVETIVIDGYVHLAAQVGLGLGAHLAAALPDQAAVVGVAKSPLACAGRFVPVRRGQSRRPLFVSATGMALERAAQHIAAMHGAFRIPTLLKWVDRAARAHSAMGGTV